MSSGPGAPFRRIVPIAFFSSTSVNTGADSSSEAMDSDGQEFVPSNGSRKLQDPLRGGLVNGRSGRYSTVPWMRRSFRQDSSSKVLNVETLSPNVTFGGQTRPIHGYWAASLRLQASVCQTTSSYCLCTGTCKPGQAH